MSHKRCPKCGAINVGTDDLNSFGCGSTKVYQTPTCYARQMERENFKLQAENAKLMAACQNVVTALPHKDVCADEFWPVREMCRKALEEK